jgi:hypothetical protein
VKCILLTILSATLIAVQTLRAECPPPRMLHGEELRLADDLEKIVRELPYAVSDHVINIQISEKEKEQKGPHFTCFEKSEDPKKCQFILKVYENFIELEQDLDTILPKEYASAVKEASKGKLSEPSSGSTFSGQRISLMIGLDNDSRMYSAVRLMTNGPHEDDEGRTHGMHLKAETTLPNFHDLKFGLGYETLLFTKGLADKEKSNCQAMGFTTDAELSKCMAANRFQYFNNVNKLYLSAGRNPISGFIWNANVGFMQYNTENPSGFYNGTAQQTFTHKVFGITIPKNEKDGQGIKRGFLLEASAGYQAHQYSLLDNRILLSGKGEGELRASNLSKFTSFNLSEELQTKFQSRQGSVGVGFSSKFGQTFHSEGVESTITIAGEFFAGPFVVRYDDTTYFGKLHNYSGYDLPGRYSGNLEKTGTVFIMVDFNHWARRRSSIE